MNWDQIQGQWKQLKGSVQAKWAELTEDDLEKVKGDRDKLEGILQEKYGKSKEEVRREVDDFFSSD
ncbi:CsbD family protein [Ruegeria sp. R13_0]|uniref:CsbD family protein n=1 Tax=Ruegeria sp. R13_0 TaxID=2821099 RepID=UPI001AD98B2A|nr:CsbD family protein [Ruegeria sp. R13_0]MBO9433723.1 CsbD family protein [Ruegeria sp. R13_0]